MPWSGYLKAATVQIPLPVLGAFASIERSYFDLCIRAGQQVLDAMMEQDRPELFHGERPTGNSTPLSECRRV